MAYRVSLTARAERDLALLFHEKNAEHSEALTWYRGLKEGRRFLAVRAQIVGAPVVARVAIAPRTEPH